MSAPLAALQVVGSRSGRRLAGCGCLSIAALAALPLVLIAAIAGGALPGPGGGQTGIFGDPAGDFLVPSGEPLRPGSFVVTQGFGCTAVGVEPAAPAPYVCPPDSSHLLAVRFHTGIDLASSSGSVVYAVTAGSVRVIRSATGFGDHLVLTPAGASATATVTYLYGHLGATAVPDGAMVGAGQPIGFVGTTGNSTGPHLHFEVDLRGLPINPCPAFPAGYLAAAVTAAGCLAFGM